MLADSPAFQTAALRSEIGRAQAVLLVVFILAAYIFFWLGSTLDAGLKTTAACGLAALAALQFWTLWQAEHARRLGRGLPAWFVLGTVIVESLLPIALLAAHIHYGLLDPFASLVSPPVLMFGIIISLTTMRLSPRLCILSGGLAALGYLGVLLYVRVRLGLTPPAGALPAAAYITVPLIIFVNALAAAWVCRHLRGHMQAALSEAETRRAMDRIERDLQAARSIQQALLPTQTPAVNGFEIAGWNRPADQTGGDYYDWQRLADGSWLVTVADVCGHGIGPALVTCACRAYMRASSERVYDLAALTTQVNRLLSEDLAEGRFVTMASVLIRPNDGGIALLSAGHGPILLLRQASGEVEDIESRDMPLAVVPDAGFGPAQPIAMAAGDVLALVTDGFVEWGRRLDDDTLEQFGVDRLRDSLRRHGRLDATAMIEAIAREVAEFAHPTPQQDDLTIAIVKRVGA